MYCFNFRAAVSQNLHRTNDLSTYLSFTSKGFCDWKNALRTFRLHNHSRFHSECLHVIQQQSRSSIILQMDTAAEPEQEHRRRLFMAEVSSLEYLLRQGIAFRWHIEEEGNLFQLMQLRSFDIPSLDQWLTDKKYLSRDIVNELAEERALIILRNLCNEVKFHN